MPRERFPLVGSLTHRDVEPTVAHTKDQKFTNCFPEVTTNPVTDKSSVALIKRQGTLAGSDVAASATGSYASCIWSSYSGASPLAVFAFLKSTGTSMMFFDQTNTQVGGDVASTNACYFLTDTLISTTGNLTATLRDSGTSALETWFYPEGGAWTQITDGDFPSNVQVTHCHMDGYMFVITNRGVIHNSDLNSLSAWTAGASITAQSMPDNGVGLARYRNLVAAFGDRSLEFFYNAGNSSGSPLSPVQGSVRRVGALRLSTGASIMNVGDTVYWLGIAAESGAMGIYRLEGYNPVKVSSPFVDRLIAAGLITGIGGAISLYGMTHIAFNTASNTLMYCPETKAWWWLAMGGSVVFSSGVGLGTTSAGKSYAISPSSPKIFLFDATDPLWQDNGSAYSLIARTRGIDHGTNRMKQFKRLDVIADVQGSSSLGVSVFDDDYVTESTLPTLDLSTQQHWLTGLGAARRRAWQFTHASNTPCRIEAIEIEYEVGNS